MSESARFPEPEEYFTNLFGDNLGLKAAERYGKMVLLSDCC